jgi:hypothetical protein
MSILSSDIFFRKDLIDVSFICQNGQIDNLLAEIEESLLNSLFSEVGEITATPQAELVNVLKYFAFIEIMTNITNDFNGDYAKSYYANILSSNPELAQNMINNRLTQANVRAFRQVNKFELEGWEIFEEYKDLSNYL